MSGTADEIEWYLARDSQQFGPMSESELKRIIEMGHLRPADLIWRSGMDDWEEAGQVFPQIADLADVPPETAAEAAAEEAATEDADPADAGTAGSESADGDNEVDLTSERTENQAAEQSVEALPADETADDEAGAAVASTDKEAGTAATVQGEPEQEPEPEAALEAEAEPAGEAADPTLEMPLPQPSPGNSEAGAKPAVSVARINFPGPGDASAPLEPALPAPVSGLKPALAQPLPLPPGGAPAGLEIPGPHNPQFSAPAGNNSYGQPYPPAPGQPLPPPQAGRPLTHAPLPDYHQPAAQPAPPLQPPLSSQLAPPPPPNAAASRYSQSKGSGAGRHIVVVAALLLAVAGVSWLAYTQSHWIIKAMGGLLQPETAADATIGSGPKTDVKAQPPIRIEKSEIWAKPVRNDKVALLSLPKRARRADRENGAGAATAPPNPLQSSALWRYIAKEFPDWYKKRAAEAALLKEELPDDQAVIRTMDVKLVVLRRRYARYALVASQSRLRAIADSFLNTVRVMEGHSVAACYGFISDGETSSAVAPLLKSTRYSKHLDEQNLAILKAISEGRRQGQTYQPPQPVDYRALGTELTARGWSNDDLQLFTDPVALSSAAPAKVCRMVQQWFAAQLSLPNSGAQIRLLVQSLRPVIAG